MHTAAESKAKVKPKETGTREYVRALFSVPFELRPVEAPTSREVHGISVDISEGGVGALVQGSLRVGELVEIELPVAGRLLRAIAIVRHTSTTRSGFEFMGLNDVERRQITRVVGTA